MVATCCNSLFLNPNQTLPSPQTMYFTEKRHQQTNADFLVLCFSSLKGRAIVPMWLVHFGFHPFTQVILLYSESLPLTPLPHPNSNTSLRIFLKPVNVPHIFHHSLPSLCDCSLTQHPFYHRDPGMSSP